MITDNTALQTAASPKQTAAQQQVLPLHICQLGLAHSTPLLLFNDATANTSHLMRVQAKELLRRKSALIMRLTTAGADLEQVIKDNQHEIDEVLLKMLEKRAEAAYKYIVLPQKLPC